MRSIFITGGTGSFGKRFVKAVYKKYPNVERVVIYSRDELKQFEMAQDYPHSKYPSIRFFLGDVRDASRLRQAMEGIDVVVHAAALKQVPAAEYNPFEAIKTNVLGAQNVIEAAIAAGVKNVVALSTDKAAAPINLYGATKLCSDKLFIAANNIKGKHDIKFSVVRYGNVMGSRGSVVPFFLDRRSTGVLPITDPNMTRFNISLDQGVDMVFHAMDHAMGGEIFVPKIPSFRITDLVEAIGPECKAPIVGIRPGEKLHEEMITHSDSQNTIGTDRYYIIVPTKDGLTPAANLDRYIKHHGGKAVPMGFCYSSGDNPEWLGVDDLRKLIREQVDPNFDHKKAPAASV